LSDTKVYEPEIRALLGTATQVNLAAVKGTIPSLGYQKEDAKRLLASQQQVV